MDSRVRYVYVIEGRTPSGKNHQRIFRNRRTGKPFNVKSKAATEWLGHAHLQLLGQRGHRAIPVGPYTVERHFYQSSYRTDLDNMVALVNDACSGVIITDDSEILEDHNYYWIDKARPRVELTIIPRP